MKIASTEIFLNEEVYQVLPNSGGTLDELTYRVKDDEDLFMEKVQKGKIFTDMTRENAKYPYGKNTGRGSVFVPLSEKRLGEFAKDDRLRLYREELLKELERMENAMPEFGIVAEAA